MNHRERKKLRRVLYCDLAEMFNIVDQTLLVKEGNQRDVWDFQEGQIRRLLSFRGEEHMKQESGGLYAACGTSSRRYTVPTVSSNH